MRRALLFVAGLGVLFAVFVTAVVVVRFLQQPQTSEVRRLADSFEAPATWVLVDETVRGRSLLCVDGSCPSIVRRWELEALPATDELRALVGGDDVDIDRQCRPLPNFGGASAPICRAEATRGDLDLVVRLSGSAEGRPRPFTATLFIEAA